MTDNTPSAEQIQALFHDVADKFRTMVQDGIKAGPGHHYWDGIKRGRTEFGHCVAIPTIAFESTAELDQFLRDGFFPESMGDKFMVAFIDLSCIDEFITHTGVNIKREVIEGAISELLEATDRTFEQALMPLIIIKAIKLDDGSMLCGCDGTIVDWWDTEAETKPYPGITKAKVKKVLQAAPRILQVLSTRNPLQAGKNMNVWLDVCKEMNLAVIVDAETSQGLEHLQPRHRSDMLMVPFKAGDQKKAAAAQGIGNG